MRLKQFAAVLAAATACSPSGANSKAYVIIKLKNKTSIMLVTSLNAGRGEMDLGCVIADPDSTKGFINFEAAVNAPLNFRYQFENGSLQAATNLLGRGIRANEEITITVTDSGVSAKAVDGRR